MSVPPTVVFVHGTGVRQPRYGLLVAQIGRGLAAAGRPAALTECYWGGPHGADLAAGGVSIPSGTSVRGPAEDGDSWALLDLDPAYELRLLAIAAPDDTVGVPGVRTDEMKLAERCRELPHDPAIVDAVRAAGLHETFAAAVDHILTLPESSAGTRPALARAFVAEALVRADQHDGGTTPLDGDHRDALVRLVVAALGGTDRGIGAWAGRSGVRLALALGATRPVERRRAAITGAATPFAGDVLRYLSRGAAIRDHIAETVRSCSGPVVLLAHSLGGIACVDLLVQERLPQVTHLVTVGSQAPYLYELDALPSRRFGEDLPDTFPAWLNVVDRRDLLAFAAEGVFPRARDAYLDNRMPFPRSHSAYFANAEFYRTLAGVL